jgi:hypothetical protein
VPRCLTIISALLLSGACSAQEQDNGSVTPLVYTSSISVPLNAVQLYDKALHSWNWTFGREPGATLKRSDRENGIIEGTARINFRSEMLTGREESMGTIQYRVQVQLRAGECRTIVSELTHAGNHEAPGGGLHLGLLTRSAAPPQRLPGLGKANVQRLYAELKAVAGTHCAALMQQFDARLRTSAEP